MTTRLHAPSLWHLFHSPQRGAHSCEQDYMRRLLSAPVIFLPPLLPERMSLDSNGEVVHTRGTYIYQVVHRL